MFFIFFCFFFFFFFFFLLLCGVCVLVHGKMCDESRIPECILVSSCYSPALLISWNGSYIDNPYVESTIILSDRIHSSLHSLEAHTIYTYTCIYIYIYLVFTYYSVRMCLYLLPLCILWSTCVFPTLLLSPFPPLCPLLPPPSPSPPLNHFAIVCVCVCVCVCSSFKFTIRFTCVVLHQYFLVVTLLHTRSSHSPPPQL